MLSEIGSNFWITPDEIKLKASLIIPDQFGCKGTDYVLMSTGRGATSFVLDTIERKNNNLKKVAVIPPFTCHTVIEPFLARGYEVHAFHIGLDLRATSENILNVVKEKKAGVVLFHRFFGINTISDIDKIIPKLRSDGVVIIEDCTQNLYSTYIKSDADYFVGSIRKWCGVPDGGFAVCNEGKFENKPIDIDRGLELAKCEASIRKYEFLFESKGDKQSFLTRYREAEDMLDAQNRYYAISKVSCIIQSNLDIHNLKTRRRENFYEIVNGLKTTKGLKVIFEQLNEDEVPLYCPILCENRKAIQQHLVQNSIYAPVVWPKAECCPAVDGDTDYIYEHILCIPIDQRYGIDDMHRVVNVIKEKLYA